MSPPEPCWPSPVRMATAPLSPLVVLPVDTSTAPLTPDVPAGAVSIEMLPLEVASLKPLVTFTWPPSAAAA